MKFFNTPVEIIDINIENGAIKASRRAREVILLGILAGIFISFGASACSMAMHSIESAGLARAIGGAIFPVGLMLVVFLGAELFTGNCLIPLAVMDGKVKLRYMIKNLVLVFISNMAGAVFVAALSSLSGQWNTSTGLLGAFTLRTAVTKAALTPLQGITSGILCNILVCCSILVASAATDVTGKIWAIFFTIWAFATCGFEHCVANMYYLPAGLFAKTNPQYIEIAKETYGITEAQLSNLTIGSSATSILWVTLGNVIGGMVFVGLVFFVIHRKIHKPGEAD